MKKTGIVGGVSWLSTVEYYSELCRRGEKRRNSTGVPEVPEMVIESLDLGRAISYLGELEDDASWARFDDYHRAALQRLEASGAEIALIASNSAHHRFEAITEGAKIPVLSIIDVMAR